MQKHYYSILQATCFGYLLESPHRGDSHKYPKHMFYEEIRIKYCICCISFCSLRILYNSKFILTAISLGTNADLVQGFTVVGLQCVDSEDQVQPAHKYNLIKVYAVYSQSLVEYTVEPRYLELTYFELPLISVKIWSLF